jgi:hypothetical protein
MLVKRLARIEIEPRDRTRGKPLGRDQGSGCDSLARHAGLKERFHLADKFRTNYTENSAVKAQHRSGRISKRGDVRIGRGDHVTKAPRYWRLRKIRLRSLRK